MNNPLIGTVEVPVTGDRHPVKVTLPRLHPNRPTPRDAYRWSLDCWQCAIDEQESLFDPDAGLLGEYPTKGEAFEAAESHERRRHGGADTVRVHRLLRGA